MVKLIGFEVANSFTISREIEHMKTKIAIVGLGKIAKDQHVPSISASANFELAAIVSRNASIDGLDAFKSIEDLILNRTDIKTVAICVPPQVRFEITKTALNAGLNVLLEKPPGSTLAEVKVLENLAKRNGCQLFATWHSRFANGVPIAKNFLKKVEINSIEVIWKEDVRRWHPGQDWIWQPGGLGVFDPGINALSIVSEILPEQFLLTDGVLHIPSNLHTPIAADLNFETENGKPLSMVLDFLQTGPQTWDVNIETEVGLLALSGGGSNVSLNDETLISSDALDSEYAGIYARFAELIAQRESDVDITPLIHVADCFMLCKQETTEAFIE